MSAQMLLGPNGLIYTVKGDDEQIHVLWGGLPIHTFHAQDTTARRIGIAQLASIGVAQKTISEVYDVERHTVRNIHALYRAKGIEGLVEFRPGPKGIGEELKQFVLRRYLELDKRRGYQNIILTEVESKVASGEFRCGLSRSKLQKLIAAHKAENRTKKEELQGKRKEAGSGEGGSKGQRPTAVQPELPANPQPVCVQHGGAAAVIPLLGQLGLAELIAADKGPQKRLYRNGELVVGYTALNAAQVADVEQDFKLLPGYQMGGILGRIRLPSKAVYQERMGELTEGRDMPAVMLASSVRAARQFGPTRIAYVDGHFMPYWGQATTLYGYHTQRRLAVPGREYIFVHDESGRPICALLSDEYRKLQFYLEKVDAAVRTVYGVGEKQILEVFDRGGYSKQFCLGVAGRIRFICWRSDARVTPVIPAGGWQEVVIAQTGNTIEEQKVKRLQAWERRRRWRLKGQEGQFREIWIKSGRKVSPAVSNDFERSLGELVGALVGRWGRQENMFKDLKAHGIDRIHTYRKENYEEELLYERGLEERGEGIRHHVANPRVREVSRQMAETRQESRGIDQRIVKAQKAGKRKELTRLRKKAAGLVRRLANLKKRRAALPKKVLLMDKIEEEGAVRLSDGKKLFFDCMKLNAIWAKKMLTDVVKPYYEDLRDLNKFVVSVLQSRTYVRREGDVLHVDFPPCRSKHGRAALEAMCEFLNTKGDFDLGLTFRRLVFRVGTKH